MLMSADRCASGIEGLKEQGVTNYITLTFIMKYNVLFLDSDEMSPHSPAFILVSVYICMCISRIIVQKPKTSLCMMF